MKEGEYYDTGASVLKNLEEMYEEGIAAGESGWPMDDLMSQIIALKKKRKESKMDKHFCKDCKWHKPAITVQIGSYKETNFKSNCSCLKITNLDYETGEYQGVPSKLNSNGLCANWESHKEAKE